MGDLNGDSNLDVAVPFQNFQTVGLGLGNGDGTFTPGSTVTGIGTQPYYVAMGDLNGDSILDLAIVSFSQTNVHVRLGDP